MKRIVALDIGDRRIGIAVSDPLGLTAQPIETYTRVGYGPDVRHISEIAAQYDTDEILSGLPRNMDGTEGFQIEKVREFCGKLTEAGLKVQFYDERLTTVLAENALMEDGMSRANRKKKVDMVAAALILESWLDANRAQSEQAEETPETEEEDNVLEMEDEDGNPVRFLLTAHIPYEGNEFVLVSADEDTPDFAKGESFLMECVTDDQGQPCYRSLEDEAMIEKVWNEYLKQSEEN